MPAKLVKNIYRDTFLGKHVRFTSTCEVMPFNVTGTVKAVTDGSNGEILFVLSPDQDRSKKMTIGSNSKNLTYEFI